MVNGGVEVTQENCGVEVAQKKRGVEVTVIGCGLAYRLHNQIQRALKTCQPTNVRVST